MQILKPARPSLIQADGRLARGAGHRPSRVLLAPRPPALVVEGVHAGQQDDLGAGCRGLRQGQGLQAHRAGGFRSTQLVGLQVRHQLGPELRRLPPAPGFVRHLQVTHVGEVDQHLGHLVHVLHQLKHLQRLLVRSLGLVHLLHDVQGTGQVDHSGGMLHHRSGQLGPFTRLVKPLNRQLPERHGLLQAVQRLVLVTVHEHSPQVAQHGGLAVHVAHLLTQLQSLVEVL
mmetsp:Transcript_11247/g.24232  ORF Transcript_11247/g.24232 Transcript_11247/m.24232 type:complete len:229 (-) Transcript_11247:964-1650(-)